jgi:replicative DNA helicase
MNGNNGNGTAPDPVRLAPQSEEAEEAVLGGILINPAAYQEASAIISREMFWNERRSMIWDAITRLSKRGEEIDNVTVVAELHDMGKLDEIGGEVYITRLMINTPASLFVDTYARIIERASIRRGYLAAASTMAKAAVSETDEIEVVINICEAAALEVAQARHKSGLATAQTVMNKVFERVEKARISGVSGVPTGLTDLDKLLGGLQDTDLIIVAGRPGSGKTSLGLTIGFNRCEAGGVPLILSKEMGQEQLGQRMIAMDTGISTHKMRTGKLDDREWQRFVNSYNKISQFKFVVDDSSNMPLSKLAGMIRRAVKDHGVDLVIVDYLQLVIGEGENRTQQVGSVSRTLKGLARELNIPILCMAQLNRKVEDRKDKRPMLADLAESGNIEQDADIVIFIYRDEMYNEATERPNQADLMVAKHRNGPTGVVSTYFRKELTQFSNLKTTTFDLAPYSPNRAENAQQTERKTA